MRLLSYLQRSFGKYYHSSTTTYRLATTVGVEASEAKGAINISLLVMKMLLLETRSMIWKPSPSLPLRMAAQTHTHPDIHKIW